MAMAAASLWSAASPTASITKASPATRPSPMLLGFGRMSKSLGRKMVAPPPRSGSPDLDRKVEQSIKAAEETCAEDAVSAECKVAWEEVEELSAAVAHKKAQASSESNDPLDKFCEDNPETDECRVYED